MEFILDTVNLEEIKDGVDHMPIAGVTSNPSIVKKTSPEDFFGHMRKVREIIGKERSLHVQVISLDAETIVKEAHRILEEIDDQVYIKVPVSYEGLKAIKILKSEEVNVTATAVYDLMQAYFALAAGADYIAPYAVLKQVFANPNIDKAVTDFNNDWYAVYGEGKGICDL